MTDLTIEEANELAIKTERLYIRLLRELEYERFGESYSSPIVLPNQRSVYDCMRFMSMIDTEIASLKAQLERLKADKERFKQNPSDLIREIAKRLELQ